MYCKKCGRENPEGSKFCQHCGITIGSSKTTTSERPTEIIKASTLSDNTKGFSDAYPIKKLSIMLVVTYGVYFLYWFEKNWQLIKKERQSNISPFWRTAGLFVPILGLYLVYKQFKEIKKLAEETGIEDTYSPGWSLIGYLAINILSLGFLAPFVLNRIQTTFNNYWKLKEPNKEIKTRFSWKEILALLFFMGLYLLILLGLMYPADNYDNGSTATDAVSETHSTLAPDAQEEIVSSVVNIFCPSIEEDEEVSGGSGIILSDDGIILTNSHIIPQDEEYIHVDEDGCLVVLPNPETGQPEEIFLATPIVIPGISDTYDLAFMSIYSAYYNEEDQEYKGTYPRKFPAFDDSTRCIEENVRLGEKVIIFGYPTISGGYSLTITEGVVSSFPGEGLVVTSAKISQGNSGGLAVDERGCMIGVPSFVSSDEYESLGVIISVDLIKQFTNEVLDYLDKLDK